MKMAVFLTVASHLPHSSILHPTIKITLACQHSSYTHVYISAFFSFATCIERQGTILEVVDQLPFQREGIFERFGKQLQDLIGLHDIAQELKHVPSVPTSEAIAQEHTSSLLDLVKKSLDFYYSAQPHLLATITGILSNEEKQFLDVQEQWFDILEARFRKVVCNLAEGATLRALPCDLATVLIRDAQGEIPLLTECKQLWAFSRKYTRGCAPEKLQSRLVSADFFLSFVGLLFESNASEQGLQKRDGVTAFFLDGDAQARQDVQWSSSYMKVLERLLTVLPSPSQEQDDERERWDRVRSWWQDQMASLSKDADAKMKEPLEHLQQARDACTALLAQQVAFATAEAQEKDSSRRNFMEAVASIKEKGEKWQSVLKEFEDFAELAHEASHICHICISSPTQRRADSVDRAPHDII